MARLLCDGEAKEITPQQGRVFCYDELRALIAGPLEAIPLAQNEVMLVDAHGQRKQLAPNTLATPLVRHFLRPGEMIAGPALVATVSELDEGRMLSKRNQDQAEAKSQQERQADGAPYMPDEQEQQRIVDLQRQLEPVLQQIAQLEASQRDPRLEELGKYFHLGRVGGSGRGTSRLNRRREGVLDKSIDTAKKLEPLYQQRANLLLRIETITSGKQKQRREAEVRKAEKRAASLARIRAVETGEYVLDGLHGIVKVVRVNTKTLTIETSSGYHERRAFTSIKDVYHPQHWE